MAHQYWLPWRIDAENHFEGKKLVITVSFQYLAGRSQKKSYEYVFWSGYLPMH